MIGRFGGIRRTLPLFLVTLVMLAIPLLVFSHTPPPSPSKHFPNVPTACVVPNASPTSAPVLASPRTIFMSVAFGFNHSDKYINLGVVCVDGTGEPIAQGSTESPCATLTVPCAGGAGTCQNLRANSCFLGEDNARRTLKALCFKAANINPSFIVGGTACGAITNLAAAAVEIRDNDDPAVLANKCGVKIVKDADADGAGELATGLTFEPIGRNQCEVSGVYHGTSGIGVNTDMLNFYFLQVDQSTGSGTLTLKIKPVGTALCTRTISLPQTSNIVLAGLIAEKFAECGIKAHVHPIPASSNSTFKKEYNQSLPLLWVPAAKTSLESVEVSGPELVEIKDETSQRAAGVPALNPWGVALLILALLLGGLWMVRWQRRLRQA